MKYTHVQFDKYRSESVAIILVYICLIHEGQSEYSIDVQLLYTNRSV